MRCGHSYITTDYSTDICVNCGLEKLRPIDSRNQHYTLNQPLWVGYSRINRFRKILQILFYPSQYGYIPGQVFLAMKAKDTFNSFEEMYHFFKKIKFKTKNYNALHLYAMYFVKNYCAPHPPPSKYATKPPGRFCDS